MVLYNKIKGLCMDKSLQKNTLNNNILNLFVAPIVEIKDTLYPLQRQEQIDKITNINKKQQSYSAWKLLEYAINTTFNYNFKDLVFTLNNGKWSCDKCYFSISHSDNFVAVLVSDNACGVDLESKEISLNLKDKILTQIELKNYSKIKQKPAYMLKKWVLKESIFKFLNQKTFIPSKIETNSFTKVLKLQNKKFMVGVCATDTTNIRLFLNCKY